MKLTTLPEILCRPRAHFDQWWLQHGAHWWWNWRAPWVPTKEGRQRMYFDDDTYCRHQASKFRWHRRGLAQVYHKRLASYTARFRTWAVPGQSVLCLGARDGMEVEAFRALGCFAWGIDLAHPSDSPYVTTGDMHCLDRHFPPACVEVVYTNSLDHAYELWRVAFQVKQLLKPGGVWWVDAHTHGQAGGAYESQDWPSVTVLQDRIREHGWALAASESFEDGMTSMRWVSCVEPRPISCPNANHFEK